MHHVAHGTGLALVLAALCAATFAAAQPAGRIVSLAGSGDVRVPPANDWQPARVQQSLDANWFIRTTRADSKMAVLLADESQMTLQGIAVAQIKPPDASAPRRSIIDFAKGTGRFQTKTPTREFTVRTPTGLAAIRGTEWVVDVADDGSSAFTVVEGEIEISNELGSLRVGADEQGLLEHGRAPTKRRVQDARERVQWVSQFTVDPSRYAETRVAAPDPRLREAVEHIRAGRIAAAREVLSRPGAEAGGAVVGLLLADIALYEGHAREAIAILGRTRERSTRDARIDGVQARAFLFADDMAGAREAVARALRDHPDALESQLAAGELARLEGDAREARRAFARAVQIAPGDWRAWHALGQVHAERADPRRARAALAQAERLDPGNAMVLGERGLVEANAFALPLARETLARAVAASPSDFATWTALGTTRLRSGDPQGALDALLRATLLEPRHARAHVQLAIAYWQLGRREDAFRELGTATRHDPRDPLPFQLAAIMHTDLLQPGEALDAAREALARLRYVKSLDAIANDLRGSANLGAPLAQLGLEAWALKNAQDSFDPLWAASHLFLADRLQGKFAANSELYQGFLADPLAFGASNRFQSLETRPGISGTLAWRGARASDFRITEPLANVNGIAAEGRLAFFAETVRLRSWSPGGTAEDRAPSYTVAIGARPRDDVGFFLYANRLDVTSRTDTPGPGIAPFQRIDGPADRFDAGVLYRPGPDTQASLKVGHGRQESRVRSRDSLFGLIFTEADFSTTPRTDDVGARITHRFANGIELTGTAEWARRAGIDFLEQDAVVRVSETDPRFLESARQDLDDRSHGALLAARWIASPSLLLEGQLGWSRYEKANAIEVRRDFVGQDVQLQDDYTRTQWSPRAGIAWKPVGTLTVRGAWQKWLRPASIASLSSPSTAGIVLDERYVLPGGKLERRRLQLEWEATPHLLAVAFADRQEIDNLYSPLAGVLNNRPDASSLERLRNRSFNALASMEVLEGFPSLSRGHITEHGMAMNWLALRAMSLFAEGTWARGRNTGDDFPGARPAFLPERRAALGTTWFPGARLSFAAKAIYRSERFADDANVARLAPEWSGALQAYFESPDKRWSVEAIATNLGAKSAKDAYGIALNFRF